MRFAADLHIHSCLSPCGDLSMSPAEITRRAAKLGLAAAALTDHNSALNAPAFAAACVREKIIPFFGIEITTMEEVHVLALFETPEQALKLGELIYAALPPIPNNPQKFGDQVYVNDAEEIAGEAEKLLITAADITLDEAARRIRSLDGLFIPAHIDRPSFSLKSQLGFIPKMDYDALEITAWPPVTGAADLPLISSSDAHYPDDIGKRLTFFEAEKVSFHAFREALKGRRVETSLGK